MPQGKPYIFALQTQSYGFWKPTANNKAKADSAPYFLNYDPSGWDEITIENVRNDRYWGIDRSVTLALTYVNDGAQILKYIFTEKGTEEPVFLCILELQLDYQAGVGYRYWYKLRYRAAIDLTTYDHTGSAVKATTLEDGITKYIKSNEKTVYEFPMSAAEAINVKMDGIVLHESLNFEDSGGFDISLNLDGNNFFGPVIYIDKEGGSTGVDFQTENLEDVTGASWSQKAASLSSFIHNANSYPITIQLIGTIEFDCTGMTSSPAYATKYRFIKTNQGIFDQNLYQIISTPAMVVDQRYSQPFNISITLQPNERLMREGIFFGGSGSDASISFTENSKFSVKFVSRYKETYVRAFRPQYLFSQFIDRMTTGEYSAAVTAYFAAYSNIVFTCGNAIRGLSDAVMKMSWDDFFQFWDSRDSVGINTIPINKVVHFARKQDLIDTSTVCVLAEPSVITVTPAVQFSYNELAFGYPEMSNDVGVLNGNEEFNTNYLYSLGQVNRPAKLDKVAKMNASCYTIENMRIATVSKDTTASSDDNSNFPLHVVADEIPAVGNIPAHHLLDRTRNASSTGLIESASVFNMGLSPHLSLKLNGPYLRSCGWQWDNKTLAYQSVDKNNLLTFTDPIFGPIVEKADENLGGLGAKFFDAVLLNITVPAPNNLIDLLDANPLMVYQFPFKNTTFTGVLMKTSTGLASHKEQNYSLLSLPTNDLKKLEAYYG